MSESVRIRVGSENSAKLEAVRRGMLPFFPKLELLACSVPSGVSEQPVGFDEIMAGARNRARASFAIGNCDLGVGIEDGLVALEALPTGYLNMGCCVLYDGRREAYGFSSGFEYPPACVAEATASPRAPIGEVFDRRFADPTCDAAEEWGSWAGNIGRLTRGVLSRADYGSHAVLCAMVRLLHPAQYPDAGAIRP